MDDLDLWGGSRETVVRKDKVTERTNPGARVVLGEEIRKLLSHMSYVSQRLNIQAVIHLGVRSFQPRLSH